MGAEVNKERKVFEEKFCSIRQLFTYLCQVSKNITLINKDAMNRLLNVKNGGGNFNTSTKPARNSSIELLKIFAIFFIVIRHITQTLGHDVNLREATPDIQQLTLSLFSYLGVLGNSLFFIASAWFLLDSDKWSKKKELSLATDVWIVSIIILAVMLIAQVNIGGMHVVMSLFPNTFANNWYLTCYLLFYPLHVFLNRIIKHIDKKSLLRLCLASGFLYIGIKTIAGFMGFNLFFSSELIIWIVIYLLIAYGKFYLPQLMNSKKANVILLITGLVINTLLVVLINFLGLHIEAFSDNLLRWNVLSNPFLISAAIGAFNLARQYTFHNKFINYVSGLSLLIYIIHENILVRTHLRPAIWQYIHENFGCSNDVLWTLAYSLVFFIISTILAAVYKSTIAKVANSFKDLVYNVLKTVYGKVESRILALK